MWWEIAASFWAAATQSRSTTWPRDDRQQLTALLIEHNPGFDRAMFAESLGFLARIPDREFEAYGVDKEYVAGMRAHFAEWQHDLGG